MGRALGLVAAFWSLLGATPGLAADLKEVEGAGFQASLTIGHGWSEGLARAGSLGECAGAYYYRATPGARETLGEVAAQAVLEHVEAADRKLYKPALAEARPAALAATAKALIAPDDVEAKRETALEEGLFLKWLGDRVAKQKGFTTYFGTITGKDAKLYALVVFGPSEGRPAARDTLVVAGTGKDGFCQ